MTISKKISTEKERPIHYLYERSRIWGWSFIPSNIHDGIHLMQIILLIFLSAENTVEDLDFCNMWKCSGWNTSGHFPSVFSAECEFRLIRCRAVWLYFVMGHCKFVVSLVSNWRKLPNMAIFFSIMSFLYETICYTISEEIRPNWQKSSLEDAWLKQREANICKNWSTAKGTVW